MKNDEYTVLDLAYQKVLAKLPGTKGRPLLLEESLKNFMLVYHAQGIIDNGGVELLLSAAFPGGVQYSDVANAYEKVGLKDEADAVRNAIDLASKYEIESAMNLPQWKEADSFLVGDVDVWRVLLEYLRRNANY
ncbi:hypothetical protein JCM19000A_05650 [Silvimonas sp. JCM 19000]